METSQFYLYSRKSQTTIFLKGQPVFSQTNTGGVWEATLACNEWSDKLFLFMVVGYSTNYSRHVAWHSEAISHQDTEWYYKQMQSLFSAVIQ